MAKLRYSDIFVPGGFPYHTYNPRGSLELESTLGEVTENLCKLATVTGHTKSGKTVLVRKVLPPEESVWVDGGVVSEENDFWSVVNEQLDLFTTIEEGDSEGAASEVGGEASAGANFILAKGEGKVGGKIARSRESDNRKSRTSSPRIIALSGLKNSGIPLVIDDFHYLPKQLQGSVVRALKPLIFDGHPVVVIAIPHRRYDAVKVERELTGRILSVQIPTWEAEELLFIPNTGFPLMGTSVTDKLANELALQAIGSPHLMQDFCREIARTFISDSEPLDQIDVGSEQLETVFKDVAEGIGRPIFEKLARGPRQRTDRVQRELHDGRTVDIYQLVLHALADLRPGLVTLEYEELRTSIREVSAAQIPQLHEVARVLKHMANIAATDQSSTPVIDFEENERRLHITDPFFAFYLRWGDLAG